MTTDTHKKPASGDQNRKAFEKWARRMGYDTSLYVAGGREWYSSAITAQSWLGFKAALRYRDELEKGHE